MHLYQSRKYAETLYHIGEAFHVPSWNTYILKRPIIIKGNIVGHDAMGIYPIEILDHETDIKSGLDYLRAEKFVSIVLVLDDFHRPNMNDLKENFGLCKKLKTHYVYDPQRGAIAYDKHHRYELKKAQKSVRVDVLRLADHMDEWVHLYRSLTERHKLSGVHCFPQEHFEMLAQSHDVIAFGAWDNESLVSCHIWTVSNGMAHSHLAASNERGYTTRAAYAVNDFALQYFRDYNVVNFGGGAGFDDEMNGLSKFKKGFSNYEADAIFCGEILDKERYDQCVELNDNSPQTSFFPAYRFF